MKPILILDNSPDERVVDLVDLDAWRARGLVQYAREATENEITPDVYGAVFVHMGNDDEAEWARAAFAPRPVFLFSGGWVDCPPAVDNEVYLPRRDFIERLPAALERYESSGGVAPADLFDTVQAAVAGGDENTVSFTGDLETDDPLCFPLQLGDDGTADYLSTLTPLASVGRDHRVVIEERYGQNGDGIELLRRLRMGAFLGGDFSRWPVAFRLDSPLDALLRQNARAAILLTPGVAVSADGSFPSPTVLTPRSLLNVLDSLPVTPGSRSARHSVANRWGAVRLGIGRRLLRGETIGVDDWGNGGRELLRDEEYWHLLCRGFLRGSLSSGPSLEALVTQDDWGDWETFLSGRANGRPLRVLYVDDEGNTGWNEVVGSLFSGTDGAADLVFYPGEGDVDAQALENLAGEPWDLVLCDLRLRPEDEERGAADPSEKSEYSGIRAIERFKEGAGRAPTPVIAFTASDSSWTHAAALEAGASSYWVKEGPEQGASEDFSRRNAAELLREIRGAVEFRERRRFLWDLIRDLRRERTRLEAVYSGLHTTASGGVSSRLDQIDTLWLRAYGYLQSTPTTFERAAYRFAPEDMAFLHLFGSLNQIRALRYSLGSAQAAMVRSSGAPAPIVQGAGWATWTDALRDQVGLDPGAKNAKPWKPKDSPRDAFYNGLLLVEASRPDLDATLNGSVQAGSASGLRGLRNQLDVIHGDVALAGSQPHATIDGHIRPLCEVLSCALLL